MANTTGQVLVDLELKDQIAAGAFPYDPGGNHPTWTTAFPVNVVQRVANTYANGAGAGQVSRVCSMSFTSSAALSVDLTATLSTDLFIGFTAVRTLLVANTEVDPTHVLRLGNDGIATNLFLGGLLGTGVYREVRPGTAYLDQMPLGSAGYTVDSTHRFLRFDPLGVAITWTVVILGN